jgi:beta-lactamase class A
MVVSVTAQDDLLRQKVKHIVDQYPGEVGLSLYNLSNGDTLSFHGTRHYPMQSVFKFPIALAILDRIDKRKFTLQHRVVATQQELIKGTWSPLAKKYPEGNIDVSVEDLLTFMIRDSDNNACDILLRLLGGPNVVDRYIQEIGVTNIRIRHNEQEMHQTWAAQFDNWSDPRAMVLLLKKFHEGKLLSAASRDLLWSLMAATTTGPRRLKGELADVVVAHRTGTSGIQDGLMAAVNDVGIIKVSEDTYVILAVFVTKAPEPMSSAEVIIARIAKAVYDHYHDR